jgi:GNAT superfamily N-acetyltransferase
MSSASRTSKAIHYSLAGAASLDRIAPLWRRLTRHHAGISTYFSGQFRELRWPDRRADLAEKAARGSLRIALARMGAEGPVIGYCVGVIDRKRNGDIESLFVIDAWRGRGVGTELVGRIVAWMDKRKAVSKSVSIAVGNEPAYAFYRRWKFYPRTAVLVQKERRTP